MDDNLNESDVFSVSSYSDALDSSETDEIQIETLIEQNETIIGQNETIIQQNQNTYIILNYIFALILAIVIGSVIHKVFSVIDGA